MGAAADELRARIETCQRSGWSCSLRARHVRALVEDGHLWLDRGLPDAAYARADRAAERGRGIRLSRAEVGAVTLPAAAGR